MNPVPEGATDPVAEQSGGAVAEREPNLPLSALDRALTPIRRMVRFATGSHGSTVRYLGATLSIHLVRASRLELPEELMGWVRRLSEDLDGFDEAPEDDQRERLSRMFAALARLDTLAGLPLGERLRPVPKVLQVDRPEPPPEEPQQPAGEEEPEGEPPSHELPEDDDEEPEEFSGDLSQPLSEIVPDLAAALAEAGLHTVGDLLLRRPEVIETLSPVHGAGRDLSEGRVAVGGRIRAAFSVLRPQHPPERWSVLTGAGPLRIRWSEPAPEAWNQRDQKLVVAGTFTDGALRDAIVVAADDQVVRIPGYRIPGVPDRQLRDLVSSLGEGIGQIRDPVPTEVLRPLKLPALGPALLQAHGTVSETGRRRLAFDEVLLAQLAGALCGAAVQGNQPKRGIGHPVLHGFAGRVGRIRDLFLYDDAQTHMEEIKRDLRRQAPMRRLLTGEVGAGKGQIALLAAAMVADAKGQVLMLCTDEAEAEARFLHSEPVLRDGGLVARLILGAPSRAQLDAVKRGEVHVVFGTIGLLEQPIEYRRLGLLVAVEREAFGRAAVLHAAMPAPRPDLLVTTAIPVGPRVLLTAYADLQASVVKDPQRRPARISLCRAEDRTGAYAEIREAVGEGSQGLIVFPMVDGRDALDLPDALRLLRVLEADAFAGVRLGLLHGGMSREERARVGEDLVHRRIDVLVCTTRIEDGPAIPGVSVVVIDQADSVDQWRLHRIIGFASRAHRLAKAILVVGELAEPDAAARIERVLSAPNGFQLTEALVQLRGVARAVSPGSAPLPSLSWFDPDTDLDLLLAAREEAHRILRADPALRRGTHADFGRELRLRWSKLFPDADESTWSCPVRDESPSEPKRRRRRRRRRR